MSRKLHRPHLIPDLNGKIFYLLQAFLYITWAGEKIEVPANFPVDFASVPRLFRMLIPMWGKYGFATIIHDYEYKIQRRSRWQADIILWQAMCDYETQMLERIVIFACVVLFSWVAWWKWRRREKK